MALIRSCFLILGCTAFLGACTGASGRPGGASYADVDQIRACQDKPFYDTLSATDRHTVIKGMTPQEREVCMSIRSGHGVGGPAI